MGQPGLQHEFQDSQGSHTEKPCLGKKRKNKSIAFLITILGALTGVKVEVLTRGTADRLLRQTSHRTVLLTLEHCHMAHNRTVSGDHRGGLEDSAQPLIHSPLSCLSADNFPHKASQALA